MSIKSLNTLLPGDVATIEKFKKNAYLKTRFVEMGLLPGLKIRLVKKMPFQGALEVKIRSYYMSLRWDDANQILVKIDNE